MDFFWPKGGKKVFGDKQEILIEKEAYLGYLIAKKGKYEDKRNELYTKSEESLNYGSAFPAMLRGAVCGIAFTGASSYIEGDISFISGLVGFSAFLAGAFGPLALKRAQIRSLDKKIQNIDEAYIDNLQLIKTLKKQKK